MIQELNKKVIQNYCKETMYWAELMNMSRYVDPKAIKQRDEIII